MGTTKTFEFVAIEIQGLQLDTVSKFFWDLPCQKNDLGKKRVKVSNGYDNTYEVISTKK